MTNHTRSPADLIAVLDAEADDISSAQELVDRARAATMPARLPRSGPRHWRALVAVAASVALIVAVAVALNVWTPQRRHSPPATATTTHTIANATKRITFDGVQLAIPADWPVIDGAHARYSCSSTFLDQADRAFLGVSYLSAPSCPYQRGTLPPADGVWMQPGGSTPPQQATTTLPGGQQVYLSNTAAASSVYVWYHGVEIQIGIGANRTVEQAILDSITYRSASADSAVLGRCPTPDTTAATVPVSMRLTAPVVLEDSNGRMQPEPSNIDPKVSAAAVWSSFVHTFGVQYGALKWSIMFGSYSAQTPAHINPDGSSTPEFRNVPTWLIHGTGIQTAYGPCGITALAPYNADTGQGMGLTTLG
jgi:hypothetical protein